MNTGVIAGRQTSDRFIRRAAIHGASFDFLLVDTAAAVAARIVGVVVAIAVVAITDAAVDGFWIEVALLRFHRPFKVATN